MATTAATAKLTADDSDFQAKLFKARLRFAQLEILHGRLKLLPPPDKPSAPAR